MEIFLNGNLKVHVGKIRYGDAARKLFALPKNAHLIEFKVFRKVAFNDSGTDVLDIGTKTDPDKFANDIDLAGTGWATVSLLDGGPLVVPGPALDIYGTYTGQNGNATAGEAYVYALFATPYQS